MLGTWVAIDGYIKLAMLTFILFIYVISFELRCKANLVVVAGNVIRFFWLFDFGWTIACCHLFWSIPYQ
jgi:hypothetical protein